MTDKVTLKEAAFRIGVHWRTLYRWTIDEKIEFIQHIPYGPIYIPESEIERVCAQKRQPSKLKFVVYFIQPENGGLIKIGMTNLLQERLKALQRESPIPLKILATSDEVSENQMHDKFAKYRRHGEWFEPAPELIKFIKTLGSYTK